MTAIRGQIHLIQQYLHNVKKTRSRPMSDLPIREVGPFGNDVAIEQFTLDMVHLCATISIELVIISLCT